MASIKINGLTKEQANAFTMTLESHDDDFIEFFNKIMDKYDVEQIECVDYCVFDDKLDPNNEIEIKN